MNSERSALREAEFEVESSKCKTNAVAQKITAE